MLHTFEINCELIETTKYSTINIYIYIISKLQKSYIIKIIYPFT